MSHGIHLISNSIPGYGRPDGRCLLCSRTSGAGAVSSYNYRADCNSYPPTKIQLTDCPVFASKRTSLICSVNSNDYKRNPDFSRQNRQNHSFSRNRNRPNTERERSENYDESEYLSSKNGPLLSTLSNSPRYQATAKSGPKEKEIVELFRKVQAQLRARAAIKEEKKMDASQGQGKETETVDSLLKLLRKHSVDQGKRRNTSSSGDFVFNQPEQNSSFDEDNSPSFYEKNKSAKEEVQEPNLNTFRRPASNFRRRSPVPRIKYQPVYAVEHEPEFEPEPKLALQHNTETEAEADPDVEPYIAPLDLHEDEEFDVMSESDSELEVESESEVEFSDSDEVYTDKVAEMATVKQQIDLSALKLPELRVLAKARGLKKFYKLKKSELVALLSRG